MPSVVPPAPQACPLSLHDALPISVVARMTLRRADVADAAVPMLVVVPMHEARGPRTGLTEIDEALGRELRSVFGRRSEEHTSELQSLTNLVCRLLLEKKNDSRSPE